MQTWGERKHAPPALLGVNRYWEQREATRATEAWWEGWHEPRRQHGAKLRGYYLSWQDAFILSDGADYHH